MIDANAQCRTETVIKTRLLMTQLYPRDVFTSVTDRSRTQSYDRDVTAQYR